MNAVPDGCAVETTRSRALTMTSRSASLGDDLLGLASELVPILVARPVSRQGWDRQATSATPQARSTALAEPTCQPSNTHRQSGPSRHARPNIEFAGVYRYLPMTRLPGFAVPALHMLGVGAQVGAGLEETVIEVEIQMMGLDVVQDEHGRHGARELAERVEDVLRLQRHATFELVVVDLRASADARAVAPGAGGVAVERPARPNLRTANASTAAAISAWCGGQYASKTPSRPVGFGVDQRSSSSKRKPRPGTSGLPDAPSIEKRSIPSNIQPPRPMAWSMSTPA